MLEPDSKVHPSASDFHIASDDRINNDANERINNWLINKNVQNISEEKTIVDNIENLYDNDKVKGGFNGTETMKDTLNDIDLIEETSNPENDLNEKIDNWFINKNVQYSEDKNNLDNVETSDNIDKVKETPKEAIKYIFDGDTPNPANDFNHLKDIKKVTSESSEETNEKSDIIHDIVNPRKDYTKCSLINLDI